MYCRLAGLIWSGLIPGGSLLVAGRLAAYRARGGEHEDGQQHHRGDVGKGDFVVPNSEIEVHPERRDHEH